MARIPMFTSWSASRLGDYDQCPFMAKLKHLDKLCPRCFKGKIMGGYDTPAICDTCGETIKKGDALERGTEIGANLEGYVNGTKAKLHKEIRHPKIIDLAKELRKDFKAKKVKVEYGFVLDRTWSVVDSRDFKNAWLRGKLDVYRQVDLKTVKVIDWKTGGIDKRTGEIKRNDKYMEQLETYCAIVLSVIPGVEQATAELAYVDCGPRFDPFISMPGVVTRKDLPGLKKKLTQRVIPMMSDKSFAPRANYGCRWCDFSKGKGGPCLF